MAIPTSRTREPGTISIDRDRCNGCGLCVEVCSDEELKIENEKVVLTGTGPFGCIACGHCMMICPNDAIAISGRFMSPGDVIPLPDKENMTGYKSLMALLQRRRSIRKYKDKPVPKEVLDQVIEAARTAPMGIPPSDVNLLVFDSKEKSHNLAKDFCDYLGTMKWMTTSIGLFLVRMLWGKEQHEMFRDFIKPLLEKYTGSMKQGKNIVTYDAPAALYFYGSPYADPADPVIAATYAMLAAESLGLGTCFIGGLPPFIQSGKPAKKFRKKHGIRYKSKTGLIVLLGYPTVKYRASINRSFANVDLAYSKN